MDGRTFPSWLFDNLLAAGQHHDGADRLYVPAASFLSGEVNAHELVLTAEGTPLFVNTVFSSLAQLTPGCSFQPVWQPPFIDVLKPEDRCHLNGADDLGDVLALGNELLSGIELADDLLRCVADAFHGGVSGPVWPNEVSHSPWTGFWEPRQQSIAVEVDSERLKLKEAGTTS